ncbi:MAG: polysaccharide deacetylase family sporulation protein PdaB, partial [Bacillota bacterium]
MKFIVFKRPALRNAMLWAILLFVVLAYRENVIAVFSSKLKP